MGISTRVLCSSRLAYKDAVCNIPFVSFRLGAELAILSPPVPKENPAVLVNLPFFRVQYGTGMH